MIASIDDVFQSTAKPSAESSTEGHSYLPKGARGRLKTRCQRYSFLLNLGLARWIHRAPGFSNSPIFFSPTTPTPLKARYICIGSRLRIGIFEVCAAFNWPTYAQYPSPGDWFSAGEKRRRRDKSIIGISPRASFYGHGMSPNHINKHLSGAKREVDWVHMNLYLP